MLHPNFSFRYFIKLCYILNVCFANLFLVSLFSSQLNDCNANEKSFLGPIVLVSTLDGKLSALQADDGQPLWEINSGYELLSSSLQRNVQLPEDAQFVPALDGYLYQLKSGQLEALPFQIETLLTTSVKLNADTVIAGGTRKETLGVDFATGKVYYCCNITGCYNYESPPEGAKLIVRQNVKTVRAVNVRDGVERWNLSIGNHDLLLEDGGPVYTDSYDALTEVAIKNTVVMVYNRKKKLQWERSLSAPVVDIWVYRAGSLEKAPIYSGEQIVRKYNNQHYLLPAAPRDTDMIVGGQNYLISSRSRTPIIHFNTQDASNALIPSKGGLTVGFRQDYPFDGGYVHSVNLSNNLDCILTTLYVGIVLFITFFPSFVAPGIYFWWYRRCRKVAKAIHATPPHVPPSKDPPQDSPRNGAQDLPATPPIDDPGETPSRFTQDFEMLDVLGKGGFGIVYSVKHRIEEQNYAVKRVAFSDREETMTQVKKEVQMMARLQHFEHPGIVRYFHCWLEREPESGSKEVVQQNTSDTGVSMSRSDFTALHQHTLSLSSSFAQVTKIERSDFIIFADSNGGTVSPSQTESLPVSESPVGLGPRRLHLYIQMALYQRGTLKDWLHKEKNRDQSTIDRYFLEIVDALNFLHEKGFVHRDLKPSNIFIAHDDHIKLGDFGLAADEDLRFASAEYGTKLYMSPEQMAGRVFSKKVDVYAIGIVYFELCYPFNTEMERFKTLSNLRESKFPENFKATSKEKVKFIGWLLTEDPDRRPSTQDIIKSQFIVALKGENLKR